jgi:hypothetical protein
MALSAGEIAARDARASSVGERIGWELHVQVAPKPEFIGLIGNGGVRGVSD